MYREDIKDLYKQKREAKRFILRDFLFIYLKLRIWFPHLEQERHKLVELVQLYLDADQNETDALCLIGQCYGAVEDHEGVDELLTDFDEMFENLYGYCQRFFEDYEDVINYYGDFVDLLFLRIQSFLQNEPYEPGSSIRYRMVPEKITFPLFDKAYKEKVMMKIPALPVPEEVIF